MLKDRGMEDLEDRGWKRSIAYMGYIGNIIHGHYSGIRFPYQAVLRNLGFEDLGFRIM